MNELLGIRKQKKALLENGKNIKKIYEMYYKKMYYKIIYPDKTIVRQKYKYYVNEILKKFNISSVNELTFLLLKFYGKKIGTCEFCEEDIIELNTRYGIHQQNCKHSGICILCKKPAVSFNKNKICYECDPSIFNQDSEIHYLNNLINSLLCWNDQEVINYYSTEKKINYAINFLRKKLNFFELLFSNLKGNSHGSEISRNKFGRTNMQETEEYIFS